MKTCLKTYALTLLSGILLALSFPTAGLYPLAWVAVAPVFFRAARVTPARAALHFLVAGWAFYSILLQWLVANIYWAGGWAIWGHQLVCLIMAAYWALFGLLWRTLHKRIPAYLSALTAAMLWALMEYLQGVLFTGFGWGSLAYSQGPDLTLLQWAAVGGGILVSGILVASNALVGLLFAEARLRLVRAAAVLVLVAGSHGVGALLLGQADYASRPFTAGVFQANFPLEMKWDPEYTEEMVRNAVEKSQWLATYEPVDLFVWPEALVTAPLDESPELVEMVAELTRETRTPLFTGAHGLGPTTGRPRNASFLVDEDGLIVERYDKIHLAPFGEYVPLAEYLPFLGKVIPAIGDLEPGDQPKVLPVANRRCGPLICFEVLFPEMAEDLRERGADCLIVITNLGWFGMSNAIPEELAIARVRAVETRLPLIHCANTGISGVFDPFGRFEPVTSRFDAAGRHIQYKDAAGRDFIMVRCAGALPVAAPGTRPVPFGPRVFPWLALGVLVMSLILAVMLPGGETIQTPKPGPAKPEKKK
ncbi:MAG TPA: apolipoprotein N-acyltransferase [Candidatus Hydrogenedentes bacterium]|nr:apolipoprotein N-acyltransferase [Candidatus Hydrogenedentota bacterium]